MHLKYLIVIFIALFFFSPAFPQSPSYSDQDCLTCHGKPEISQIMGDGKPRTLFVDPAEWSRDIHHLGKLTCVDCHTNATPFLHFREGFIDVDCARCHPIEAEEYQKNIHLTFTTITPGKELPLCYHCHTKHHILRHDDPLSSVHGSNIGETCRTCHPEVMVKGILAGTSLGKISGHRKGDIAEKFDMNVCISCHYKDSAHGSKRVYKDFCTRCHDVRSTGNIVMGPTHLNSARWTRLNSVGSGLVFFLLLASGSILFYRSRKRIGMTLAAWWENMKSPAAEKDEEDKKSQDNQGPTAPAAKVNRENHENE